jgi:membrane protease YdiL (CAAX protease family)
LRLRDTTRAALAPAARALTVFNLAWYELLAIFLILAGEGLIFAGHSVLGVRLSVLGVGLQVLNIIAVAVIVVALQGERVELVLALALISMFRVISASLALVPIIYSLAIVLVMYLPLILVIPTVALYSEVAVYGVMFIPIIAIVAHRKLSRHDLGLTGGLRLAYLIPFGTLVGVGLGLIEYAILRNNALIPNASASELIGLSIVMIFFVAVVEELLFRVLLQPQLIERSGAVAGILITSVIFGALHGGYGNVYELLFTTGAGVVFGVAFYKTKNLPFVITIHAVDDILLYGVFPFLSLALLH